ncbi:MAG: MFS transporter [Candidatus Nanopelagicales bacterium]|nr:MFS transporter [Candidatus Nanopelagicales bacterium]
MAGRAAVERSQRPHPYWVIAILAIGVTGAAVPAFALPLIGPQLSTVAGLSGTQLGFVAGASGLGLTVAMLPGGYLSDRVGSRRAFRLGAVVACLGAAGAAWPAFGSLMAGMFLVGIGTAILGISAMATVAGTIPGEKVRAYAAFGVAGAILGGLMSLAIGLVADQGRVAATTLMGVPLALIAAVFAKPGSAGRDRSPGRGDRRWDPAGTVLAALTAGSLFAGVNLVIRGNPWPVGVTLLIAGAAFAAVLVVWERRQPDPLFDSRLLRQRRFLILITIGGLASLGTGGAFTLAAQYAQLVLKASVTGVALLVLPTAALGAIAALISPSLLHWWGARALVGGALVLAASVCVAVVATMTSGFSGIFLIGVSVVTFALGLISAPLRALVADSQGASEIGRAFGLYATFRRFATVIGTALVIQTFVSTLPRELHESLSAIGLDSAADMGVETVGQAQSMRQQMAAQLSPEQLDAYVAAQDHAFTAAQRHGLAIAAGSLVLAALLSAFLPSRRRNLPDGEVPPSP